MRALAIIAALAGGGLAVAACASRRTHEEHTAKATGFVRASTERAARGAPAVAVDRDGRVFVLDAINARIARVADDDLVDVAEVPPDSDDLAIGPDGAFAVHRSVKPEILVLDPEGRKVGDVNGDLLALYRMPDATVFSIDVAVAKSRNVVWFSGAGVADLDPALAGRAVTNRTLSFGAQPLFPPGIDGQEGPWFRSLFVRDLQNVCTQGSQPANPNQNGVVFFPGSMPLYDGAGNLVGGLGISGDGVEQDDYVSLLGAAGFVPAESTWADRVKIRGVRMPFLKLPRNPEGCCVPPAQILR
jgi:uncharacterized protein GlcG (DUF336 family)